jgi:hypothetical protein
MMQPAFMKLNTKNSDDNRIIRIAELVKKKETDVNDNLN